jgi:histidinol-phosphate aminotransferase
LEYFTAVSSAPSRPPRVRYNPGPPQWFGPSPLVGAFYDLNRLSLAAANASLNDADYLASVRAKVATERDAWHDLFRRRKIRYTESHGNFVFFDSGRPHQAVAAALAAQGMYVGRAHPPLDPWVRISIGLPENNTIV